ncbi:MAG: translation initiation factor IF-2 [Patescibacteria group bacterium]|jgi:translation initiation factor IF-2
MAAASSFIYIYMEENISQFERPEVVIPAVIKVTELAHLLDKPVTEVIHYLLKNGLLVTLNDNIDFDTASIVADDFGFQAKSGGEDTATADATEEAAGELVPRAPVVTIMGHVDHGKTSLLDYIRKTKVAEKESGGITQHMGSYQVECRGKKITFLDTPGHEAFGSIRAQGTKVTDIVILVVAADEGVKPQTIEAIDLTKAANVPVVVAVTKIDRPGANIEKVKQELAQQNILTEEWGGKIPLVSVSAKTGEGVDQLLELVCLTADLAELKAPVTGLAKGIIIEAQQDIKVGQSATVIVKSGILKIADAFVAGSVYGKVRAMYDHAGKRIERAIPSMPVRVIGFMDPPQVGEMLVVTTDEKTARQLAASRKVAAGRKLTGGKADFGALVEQMKSRQGGNLNVVLKADVQGSLQAITGALANLKTNRGGAINIINEGIGNISESDVLTAQGGDAFVVGFKVGTLPGAAKMAKKENTNILSYDIIYNLTDDLSKLLVEAGGWERIETIEATGKVLKVFMSTAKSKIIGVKVTKGEAKKDYLFRVYREEEKIGEGAIKKIQSVAEEVASAASGDFGFMVDINFKIKEGDRVDFVRVENVQSQLIK